MPRGDRDKWGGARNGAGRPHVRATFRRGDQLVVERAPVGSIGTSEAGTVLNVSAHEIEVQIGDDILVLRHPEGGQ